MHEQKRYESMSFNLCVIVIVGDITPSDGVPKEEKSRREQAALNEMCEILGGGMRGIFMSFFLEHFHFEFSILGSIFIPRIQLVICS